MWGSYLEQRSSAMGKGKPNAQTQVKAMKAMKVMKSMKSMKRPAGQKDTPGEEEPMSLEDRIEMFQRSKNTDMSKWLDTLTKNQREALWQRFNNARATCKDESLKEAWEQGAKGKGSNPVKQQLLKAFVQGGCTLKGNQYFQKEMVSIKKSQGTKESDEWVPFHTILQRFGLPECMRRVKKKSILRRRDPRDEEEWQFCLVREVGFKTEENTHEKQGTHHGKMDVENWMKLRGKGLMGDNDDDAAAALEQYMPKGIKNLKALKDKEETEAGEKEDDEDDKEENEKDDSRAAGDEDIAEADVLSDQGMVQKEAHARVKNMTKLMKKVKKTLPKHSKQMLDKPLKDLQSIKPKDKLDNVKDTLFQAAVAIKKAKKLTK